MAEFLSPPRLWLAAAILAAAAVPSRAAGPAPETLDLEALAGLDLEALLEVEVSTVARQGLRLLDSAAAVTVITADEIRRSGAATLPEALRGVPGLHVGRIDGNTWAISIRGFNGVWANKLQVLVDGRSVYSPLFSGVDWDVQDLPLEEIERIEVVRGPGGTLWGANAANGTINVITRHARESVGSLLKGELRSPNGAGLTARHGLALGPSSFLRLYAKGFDGDGATAYPGLPDPGDTERSRRTGFRFDHQAAGGDRLMLQGELYRGRFSQYGLSTDPTLAGRRTVVDEDAIEGGFLLGNWHRELTGGAEWELQGYLQRDERDSVALGSRIDTLDLDFQYRFPAGERHEIGWGAGYRRVSDRLRNSYFVSFTPERRDTELFSAFLQDRVLLADGLHLTLGAKFEENDYTGFEWQPGARLAWSLDERRMVWAAATRALHTPSRSHSDFRVRPTVVNLPPPAGLTPLSISGNPQSRSESLVSWEAGFRGDLGPRLSLDLSGYVNQYDHLNTGEQDPLNPLAYHYGNGLEGEGYGLEATLNWQMSQAWRLRLDYGWSRLFLHLKPGSTDAALERRTELNHPEQLLALRSYLDLAPGWELDGALYWSDDLREAGVPDYPRLDLRLGWRPSRDLELAFGVRNLNDSRHPEFATREVVAGEVRRTLFGSVTWRF